MSLVHIAFAVGATSGIIVGLFLLLDIATDQDSEVIAVLGGLALLVTALSLGATVIVAVWS